MSDQAEDAEEDSLSRQEVAIFRRAEEFISSRGDSYQDLDIEEGVRAIALEADQIVALWMDICDAACVMRDALGVPEHEEHVGFKLKETQDWLKASGHPMVAELARLRAIEEAARCVATGWGPGIGSEGEFHEAMQRLRDALERKA